MSDAVQRQARYQRAYRVRQRNGEHVGRVPYGADVIEALLVSGGLSDEASRDRREVDRECASLLKEWAAHWLRPR
jgi:hypothetical protein